ncbi:MAG TPA: ester cyclase [Parvularculaceae bacterium]|nr:ester cyclase [Parvularculaceae bacterium]HNS86802.1 ester cyclase [Parvularculaceae bacterium]
MAIEDTARAFFEACENGKGWSACSPYCAPDATFASQAEPIADIKKLSDYADWMRDLFTPMPTASYEIKSFAVDRERNNVCVFGVFSGAHTGEGGPVSATGKATKSDYVYVMEFEDGKIRHMTKIWNAGWALRELGWA